MNSRVNTCSHRKVFTQVFEPQNVIQGLLEEDKSYKFDLFIYRTWEEGKAIIIDDSFDHEVWHNGSSFRLILIVDFWHPDLTPQQRASLSPI